MVMQRLADQSGGILVFTLLTITILSILGLALLPLTAIEYKSSSNFSTFEKAYFLAEAGVEETLAELEYNWNYRNEGERWISLDDGEYKVKIQGSGMERTIKSWGKVENIVRAIETKVQRPTHRINLQKLKDYAILSQGDIHIEELGNIYSEEGYEKAILGSWGNLYFESAQEDGKADLHIKGEIIPSYPTDHNKNINYPKNFPPSSKELMDLSNFNIEQYISWLKRNFGEGPENSSGVNRVVEFKPVTSKEENLELDEHQISSPREDQIIIIKNYDSVTLGGQFNGLIIVDQVDNLKIKNKSIINGMLIFTGNELKITEFQVAGGSSTINGSMMCLNSYIQNENWKLKLNHKPSILAKLNEYLPQNFESSGQGKGLSIHVIHWKEIDSQEEN